MLGDLDVGGELTAEQAKTIPNGRCHAAVSRTRQGLTVRTMTQQNLFGIDFGCESFTPQWQAPLILIIYSIA
jgi:hypothetical protein